MKRTIIVATGLLLLAGCTPDPGAPNTRGTVSETGGPAMQFSARGGYLEMSEADRYEFMCKDSPRGSRKVSYWSDLVPTCVDGTNRVTVFLLFIGLAPSSLDHGVIAGMTMRLYLLARGGATLAIEVDDIDRAPVDLARLAAVAESLQFGR